MLDTNICIYLMKNHPPEVQARFEQCFVGEVVISAITLAELEYGVIDSGKYAKANGLALASSLEEIPVAACEASAARSYGSLRAATPQRTKDALDKLIAAHAISLGATLVINNEADFIVFPGLRVENWVNTH